MAHAANDAENVNAEQGNCKNHASSKISSGVEGVYR